jgi:hypothetical protein
MGPATLEKVGYAISARLWLQLERAGGRGCSWAFVRGMAVEAVFAVRSVKAKYVKVDDGPWWAWAWATSRATHVAGMSMKTGTFISMKAMAGREEGGGRICLNIYTCNAMQ